MPGLDVRAYFYIIILLHYVFAGAINVRRIVPPAEKYFNNGSPDKFASTFLFRRIIKEDFSFFYFRHYIIAFKSL